VAVSHGGTRSISLSVYASDTRQHWRLLTRAQSSGATSGPEVYTFAPTAARYVRLLVSGTIRSKHVGVSDVRLY